MTTPVTEEDSGWIGNLWVSVLLTTWVISIVHAFVIRKEYLLRLEALQQGAKERWTTHSQQWVEQSNKNFSSDSLQGVTEMQNEVTKNSPSKRDMLIPYEKLLEICVKYLSDGYFVDTAIPSKKLANARAHFPVPDTERVVALIDTTVFGSNKLGLAICDGGLYWRNDWTVKTNRSFLTWDQFAESSVVSQRKPSTTVQLAEGSVLNISGSSFKKEDLVRLLHEVQALSKIVVEANCERVSPLQASTSGAYEELPRTEAVDRSTGKMSVSISRKNSEPYGESTPDSDQFGSNKVRGLSSPAITIPTHYPIPLAYSYRMIDAEFEAIRTLKEVYRSAEGLTAFLWPQCL